MRLMQFQPGRAPKKEPLQEVTVRNFDGGLNVLDNELNMNSRFARRLDNMVRGADGSLQLRFGTKLHADFVGIIDDIIGSWYFHTFVLCVDKNGDIGAFDGEGNLYLIWADEIANTLSGNPAGWGPTSFVSFTEFKGELLIGNGVDKPLLVQSNLQVRYLQDLGTGTNVNTPRARFVRTFDEYVVWAGLLDRPGILSISNRATSGTYLGDSAPNDAIEFNIGPFVTQGSQEITGIGAFRDKLVVTCREVIIFMTLGVYTGTPPVHSPTVDDVIPNYGSISHRVIQSLGEDMLFMDIIGIPSVQRALFSNNISPVRESHLVDPDIQDLLEHLSATSLQERCFAVHNKREFTTLFFIPTDDDMDSTIETIAFAYKNIRPLKIRAWSRFRGWNWSSACATEEGRVFFTQGTRVFLYGGASQQEEYDADFIGYQEEYSDHTIHTDGMGWTPVATQLADGTSISVNTTGIPIQFDWQMPWADLEKRTRVKISKFLATETTGRGEFTMQMFIDRILKPSPDLGEAYAIDDTMHTDGYGWTPGNEEATYNPTLSMDMVGGDRGGFGVEEFQELFGGGRISSDERLYAWPSKFKIFKLRFKGRTRGPLQFVSVSMYYQLGNARR